MKKLFKTKTTPKTFPLIFHTSYHQPHPSITTKLHSLRLPFCFHNIIFFQALPKAWLVLIERLPEILPKIFGVPIILRYYKYFVTTSTQQHDIQNKIYL